jgi:hypothetical protein
VPSNAEFQVLRDEEWRTVVLMFRATRAEVKRARRKVLATFCTSYVREYRNGRLRKTHGF